MTSGDRSAHESRECVMVMDCGSTTTRAIAVDTKGNLVAGASRPSSPTQQPGADPEWRIWDLDVVWGKLCEASREVCQQINPQRIKGVTVVTFGADGGPLKTDGTLAYPVISWQCQRTKEWVKKIEERVSPQEIYTTTGYQVIGFNTLLKWLWLRENAPEVFSEGTKWVMMSGLLSHRLSGEMMIEPTAAKPSVASRPLNSGTKAALNAPSANRRRKKFGSLNATKNASATGPAPRIAAIRISRAKPRTRLIIV